MQRPKKSADEMNTEQEGVREKSEKTRRRDKHKPEGGKGSERGVVGKSSMKRKKSQLNKQKILGRRETKGTTDLQ